MMLATSAALLAGCGGALQTPAAATSTDRDTPWIVPDTSTGDLLYVSGLKKLTIYSYPSEKVVGRLTGFQYATGLCSDRKGDVWVTDLRASLVSEYAHAGTKPIARLSDDKMPVNCAVDPKTGDLAVVNYLNDIYIYPGGTGEPRVYTATGFNGLQFCTYDDSGNLFVDGWGTHHGAHRQFAVPGILKLPYGGSELQRYDLGKKRGDGLNNPAALQWDGTHLVVGFATKQRNVVYQVIDLGRAGKISKKIELTPPGIGYFAADAPFLAYENRIIGTYLVQAQHAYIGNWSYPAGGAPLKTLLVRGKYFANGLALSVVAKLTSRGSQPRRRTGSRAGRTRASGGKRNVLTYPIRR